MILMVKKWKSGKKNKIDYRANELTKESIDFSSSGVLWFDVRWIAYIYNICDSLLKVHSKRLETLKFGITEIKIINLVQNCFNLYKLMFAYEKSMANHVAKANKQNVKQSRVFSEWLDFCVTVLLRTCSFNFNPHKRNAYIVLDVITYRSVLGSTHAHKYSVIEVVMW